MLEVEGERYELWVRGRVPAPAGRRVEGGRAGAWSAGSGWPLDADRRSASPAARGGSSSRPTGSATSAPATRRRPRRTGSAALIEAGWRVLPADRAALARGLVIGDDRDQPQEMVQRFRDSGLSHLTAVSGQNVALLLAAAGPLLRRPGRWPGGPRRSA